ncbi:MULTISPECIES: replication initiator protein A [Caproicibacterium]|uniref:Replication initiator protein A n=1 Tax=Caproicibacterium argilliputei TaxID=3030016 RepID=A0AA97D9S2_9FIRM|nr:replication initiator protein A [Caproicibacterium argilliputei]WOC32379.1 replication initiator protein A [Caproicibacterium argilliputei]
MSFNFYYGNDGEQHNFLYIPKALFEYDTFKQLSSESKILYSLMLDRMRLSRENGWVDDQNRVYVEYRSSEIRKALNSSKNTVTKILNELVDFGLIQRRQNGYYVMNFASGLTKSELMGENENEL